MKPPKCKNCGHEEWNHAQLGCRPIGSPPVARHAPQPKPKAAAVRQPKATIVPPLSTPSAKPKAKKTRKRKKYARDYYDKKRREKDGRKKRGARTPDVVETSTPTATDS